MGKPVEIDENEVLAYRQLTAFVDSALKNPKTRKEMLKIQKTLNPDAAIPELDAAEPVLGAVEDLKKQFEDYRKEQEESSAKREEEAKLADMRKQWDAGRRTAMESGYTDEGLKAVEEFMEKNGVLDWDIGVAAFERKNPQAAPVMPSGGNTFDFFQPPTAEDSSFMKSMLESRGDDMGALNKEISAVLNEGRGYDRH